MFRLDPKQISALTGDGRAFTAFMDLLIRTHGTARGVSDSLIHTNLEVTIPDGGIDTTVDAVIPGETTGRFLSPTVWQYKAQSLRGDSSVRKLLQAGAVKDKIASGYAFRLATSASLTVQKKADLVTILTEECRHLNPDSAEADVLSANDLAAWANRYPFFVLGFLRPEGERDLLLLEAWASSVTDATPVFVPVPAWTTASRRIQDHVRFEVRPPVAVCTMQGESGVGKSRLVYETLAAIPGLKGLLAYCSDGATAENVARMLANAQAPEGAVAVLVADESRVDNRAKIEQILRGHRDRVRVVAIDNSSKRSDALAPELWIEKMPENVLEKILEANFPLIPSEHRRAYAHLAGGYPRFASDLCNNHAEILRSAGSVVSVLPPIGEYLTISLKPAQKFEALQALSLFARVGHRDEVATEYAELCKCLAIEPSNTKRLLDEIHDGPGFVAHAGRYYYVTPPIVARTAFRSAWIRWSSADIVGFLERIPHSLLPAFLDQVNACADDEVRRSCGDYFRGWAERLTAANLTDGDTTARLVALVDTLPASYLPVLGDILEKAPISAIREIRGDAVGSRWGPRRALVWLAERMAKLPDTFDSCERILLRLSVAESEAGIGNNATGTWQQLFRIILSGTPVPFSERLSRLEERLRSEEPAIRNLAIDATDTALSAHGLRMIGDVVVAGKIPPPEWLPETKNQERECYRQLLEVLTRTSKESGNPIADQIRDLLIRHLRSLVWRGFLEQIKQMLCDVSLEEQRLSLLESLEEFLVFDAQRLGGPGEKLVAEINSWRRALVGEDFHARLVATVGKKRWSAIRIAGESWETMIQPLVREVVQTRETLESELDWLLGPNAHSAYEFGLAVGRNDQEARYLVTILDRASGAEQRGFALGYVQGHQWTAQSAKNTLVAWLDRNQTNFPHVASEIAMSAGGFAEPFRRVTRLFDEGRVSLSVLYALGLASIRNKYSEDEVGGILKRLADVAVSGDENALRAGLDMLAFRYHGVAKESRQLVDENVRNAAWALAEAMAGSDGPRDPWWGEIVQMLAKEDSVRAAEVAARGLVGSYGVKEQARDALLGIVNAHPLEVMEAIGKVALDAESGWRFQIGSNRSIVAAIPLDIVQAWVKRVGVEGVRRIARSLPEPYLDSAGVPTVPELTAWILRTFESDDPTFHEFFAGIGSFEILSGDISAAHMKRAEKARAFRNHPLKRIREWSKEAERIEIEQARRAKEWTEEMDLV
jgi:hypothetical protein